MAELTLMGFARALSEGVIIMEGTRHRDMTAACKALQRASVKMIGHYQTGSSQFASWRALMPQTQFIRDQQGYTKNDPLWRSGELRVHILYDVSADGSQGAVGVPDAIVGDGSPGNAVRNIGEIALDLEMGTTHGKGHIPPRSFLGLAASRGGKELAIYLGGRAASALFSRGGTRLHVPDIKDF